MSFVNLYFAFLVTQHKLIFFPFSFQLVAESATGKPARDVARIMIPGPAANLEHLNYRAGSVAAEVQKTRLALNERGNKLGQLEDRTQRMANEAENFSTAAHQLMAKYRDKKWYQL
jgi:syntaxin-binding protein 5